MAKVLPKVYYAIRKKDTDLFLTHGEKKKGFTFYAANNFKPPRLFTKIGSAKQALVWWLRGVTKVWYGYEGDEDWITKPVEDRKSEDMEIVVVTLNFGLYPVKSKK